MVLDGGSFKKNRFYVIFKRSTDVVISSIVLVFLVAPVCCLGFVLYRGSPFYTSNRVGVSGRLFRMYKLRTMRRNTPLAASDQLSSPESYLIPGGRVLRLLSLDELPQFWNVFKGDMSLVGPRPSLPIQTDLIKARVNAGISCCKPGITGLAQINGRDYLSIEEKVFFDGVYCYKRSIQYDFYILIRTLSVIFRPSNISH